MQLEDDQIHIFDKGEEEVPKRFSAEPKVPKKAVRIQKKPSMAPIQMPEPGSSGTRIMIIGVVAAVIGISIGLILLGPRVIEEPDVSTVEVITLLGESDVNQAGVQIFRDDMEVRANITIVEGKLTSEGVRFYYGLAGVGWVRLGNTSSPVSNRTYAWSIDTNSISDGVYQIKVNFTDSEKHTWHKVSRAFIIDNNPDAPESLILRPFNGDTLTGEVAIIANVLDDEDNILRVTLSFSNDTVNWIHINGTRDLGRGVYHTYWDTSTLNETTPYSLRVRAEDRNKYIDTHYITVNILHNR